MLTIEESIFDLLGKGSTVYHSAIITSFTFDPYYFSNYYMPQLRSRGIKNVIVLIDSSQYDKILEDTETFNCYRHDFALIRIHNKYNGVFHPKVSLYLGDNQALALIGSGNLTYSGMSHNKELWGAFCANNTAANEAVVIRDVWNYLSRIINSSSSKLAIQQLEWCKQYSAAIRDFEPIESPQQSKFKFLHAEPQKSIFDKIKEIVNGEIQTIKVIAPYYDMKGSLINELKKTFNPKKIKCAIDESYGYIPNKMEDVDKINFFHWHEIYDSEGRQESAKRLHAKAIQFETSGGTFLVFGSANATSAAFGLNTHFFNDEAIIILQSANEDFFSGLGIDFNKKCAKSIKDFKPGSQHDIKYENETILTHITSCERDMNDKLHILLDKNVTGAKVRLYLNDGYRDFELNNKAIELCGLGKIQYAVIVAENKEISNKSLVLDFADLVRRNPDSQYSKIERLFHADNGDWDDNITKVLTFVSFEVKQKNNAIGIAKGTSNASSKNETTISKEQFDDTRFSKGAGTNYYSLSMQILDQIQFFNSQKQDNADEIDESVNMDDLVVGNAPDDSDKKRILKSYSSKNEILSYLKRLKSHYDTLAQKFDDQDPFYRLRSQGVHIENNITCNDYSYMLIALILIFHRIAYPIKGDDNTPLYKDYFAELIGRFMMIYRSGYPNTSDFTYTKLEEMHRNFFIYSLLILSCCNMSKNHIETWTLNLLETYKDRTNNIKCFYRDYLKLAEEYSGIINSNSSRAIKNALDKYLEFIKTKGQIVDISENSANFYIYREDFGFIFCKKVMNVRYKKAILYSLEVIYPGIKNMQITYTNNATKVRMV